MLAAPSGAAGFFARHHTAALSGVAALVGMASAIATALSWFQTIAWIDVAALAAGAVLAAAVAWWQTRHAGLALIVAVAPLPGLLWAAPFSAGSHFGMVPVAAYGFGFALAALYAQQVLDRLLREVENEAPWCAAGVVVVLMAVLAGLWFWRTDSGDAALQAVADVVAVSVSVLLVLPLAVRQLGFDEATVASANRARERRGRFFDHLGGATVPRWGLSFSGIVLVFLALGWFGADAMLPADWWRYGVMAGLVGGVLGRFAGGWREGVGLAMVAALACLVLLWWRTYDGRMPFGAVTALQMAMLAGILALCGARHLRALREAGDPSDVARRRALEESSGAVFAALGAVAASLPSLLHAGAGVIVLAIAVGGLAGALLFPILLTGLEALVPRRRSVEEVFYAKTQRHE